MTLDRERLLGVAQAEREALGRTIQYTDPPVWDAKSRVHDWRNRDVVAHLAASEGVTAAAMGNTPAQEVEEFLKSGNDLTVEGFNDWTVKKRAEASVRDVIKEWGQNADAMLARAALIPKEEWATRRVSWLTGEIPTRFLLQSRIMEWWVHGEDIRFGSAEEPRHEHWPIYCTNDLGIRTLPWALGLSGLHFEGKSVEFVLDGPGGGRWHHGLAPRDLPIERKVPNALVEGRGEHFGEVASRRRSGVGYVEDGTLVISGDEELALTVLTHIRAFA